MHMISKKDLNSAELETLTTSRSPTTVITANGEVQTHEEATVSARKRIGYILHWPAVLSLGKLCDEHGHLYEWINGQQPHLIQNGFRVQCKTENIVPIVVPGLSACSSSSSHSSTSMTPSRQESDHPTSSSSSSTSPTTTVLSDSETRARKDLSGIDSHPVPVSSSHVERIERGDPLLPKPTKNPKTKKKKRITRQVRGDPFHSDIPEWLQEIESTGQKSHLIKNGFRIQCNTANFVPIVVPGLSTSSSSSFPSSTSMTPSRQEIDHPKSSSSSSTSPPMTSSTVSSETVAIQERRDLCGIHSYPAAVSCKHVEREERGDPCSSEISEEQLLTKPTKNPKIK